MADHGRSDQQCRAQTDHSHRHHLQQQEPGPERGDQRHELRDAGAREQQQEPGARPQVLRGQY